MKSNITKIPQYTEHEIKLLKAVNDLGYPYVAKDKDGRVFGYSITPKTDGIEWFSDSGIIELSRQASFNRDTDLRSLRFDEFIYVPNVLEDIKMKIEEHPLFKRPPILRYEGIGPNKYKNVMEYEAFDYAMHECGLQLNTYRDLDPEFKKMLVDWFYSGNWIEVREGEN